jgi:hypothetical protein
MKALYFKKEAYFVDMFGKIKSNRTTLYSDRNNCSSLTHIEQWLSINDLLNVAFFLNEGWIPDWKNTEEDKYVIVIESGKPLPFKVNNPVSFVYFSSEDIANKAIAILGDEPLRQILQG